MRPVLISHEQGPHTVSAQTLPTGLLANQAT